MTEFTKVQECVEYCNSNNLALGVTFLIIFWTSTGATNSFLININEMHDFDYRGSLNSYFLRFAFTIVFILLIVFFVFLIPFGVNSLNDLIPFDLLFLIKFLDKIILPLLVFIIIFNLFYFGILLLLLYIIRCLVNNHCSAIHRRFLSTTSSNPSHPYHRLHTEPALCCFDQFLDIDDVGHSVSRP